MLSAQLVRSALDSAPDAMIIIDPSGSVLFANHQITALFGYAPEKVVGRKVEMLLPERFRERHVGHRSRYVESGRVRPMGIGLELFALRANGTEFPVEISLSPIRDGEEFLITAAIRDVTDRMKTERALKEARSEADRANLAKSRFLATASHDLRQPLQSLGLLNGTLRRLVSDPDASEALDQQGLAIAAMSRLLNALLDISKLESGAVKPDITDFHVQALLNELRAEFAGLARNKGLQFTIETSPESVRSDPSLVGQILRNLIANAIKYTNNGTVWLGCRREGDTIHVEVRDSGIGIPRDQLSYIYEEFYQVGIEANASRDGYGLGLSIVHRLVALLGLRIEVQSEVGVGSTFSLKLPMGTSIPASASPSVRGVPAPVQPMGQKHVLLVEDNPGVRNATRIFLKSEGFRVTATASVEEAVQCAMANRDIDIIVSDFHLGAGKTGTEAIALVREILGEGTKAVLVTGDTSSAIRDLHRDAHLRITSKPINADEMLAMIHELLTA